MGIHLGARTTDAFPHVEKDRFGSCAVMSHLFSCSDSVFMCGYIYIYNDVFVCLCLYVYDMVIYVYVSGSWITMSYVQFVFPPCWFLI